MGIINLWNKTKLYRLYQKMRGNPELLSSKDFWLEVLTTAWNIKEIREMLKGYKTYIVAILTAALTLLHSLGYIDDTLYQSLLALLAAGAVGTVAAKINRLNLPK